MDLLLVILILVLVVVVWYAFVNPSSREGISGYGVTSGLAFNNRLSYCQEGNGAGWSGGCFLPHRVII